MKDLKHLTNSMTMALFNISLFIAKSYITAETVENGHYLYF